MIEFQTKKFSELSALELYRVLELRAAVFVVEQRCVYLDVDGLDVDALHVLGFANQVLVAYARVLPADAQTPCVRIGRVLTAAQARGLGYGRLLVAHAQQQVMRQFGAQEIAIHAQQYLERFYTDLGFATEGAVFLEDGIAHLPMRFKAPAGQVLAG
jgi:ElaA protein